MLRVLLLLLGFVMLAAFALLNGPAFMAPTELNLGLSTVRAPLALILLGLLVVASLLFGAWAISLQTSALMDSRRFGKDLHAQRELADKAEASRFIELRNFMSAELLRVSQASSEARAEVLARLDRLHDETRKTLDETSNSLAASLGELEDRIEHQYPGVAERQQVEANRFR